MTETLLDQSREELYEALREEAKVRAPFQEERVQLKRKLKELEVAETKAVESAKRRCDHAKQVDRLAHVIGVLMENEGGTVAVPEEKLSPVAPFFDALSDADNKHSEVKFDELADEWLGAAEDRHETDQKCVDLLKSIWERVRVEYNTELVLYYATDMIGITQTPDDDDFEFDRLDWTYGDGKDPELDDENIDDTSLCPDETWDKSLVEEQYGELEDDDETYDKEGVRYHKRKSIPVYVLKLVGETESD